MSSTRLTRLAPLAPVKHRLLEHASRYRQVPSDLQVSLRRQQLQPLLPQHALGRRRPEPVPQQMLQRSPPPAWLQKSPPLCRQRRLRLPSVTTSWASALPTAKRPIAEATSAAPASFIALPRVIAPVSRPVARSSKVPATPPSLLFVNNDAPPFPAARYSRSKKW
jgi:hypothetical protein